MDEPEITAPEGEATELPSMDDTIREQLRSMESAGEEPGEATPGRQRDAAGRFAKTVAEVAAEPEQAAPVEKKPYDDYPVSWQKELAEQWATLPEAVRQQVYKREQDFHNGIAQYREAAAVGNALWGSIGPHIDTMRQVGVTPQQVVPELMGLWHTMVAGSPEQKRETLLRIAQQAGIDIPGSPSASTDTPGQSPELAAVLQRQQQFEQQFHQFQQAQQQQEYETRLSEVSKFAGDPKNEFFPLVQDDMLEMIRTGFARSLADAYDKAIKLSPAVAAKQAEKAAAEQARKDAEKAAAAKKASAANVTRRGTAPVAPRKGTMDDTIREEYRRLNG